MERLYAWKLRPGRVDELSRLVAIDDDACTLYAEVGRDVNLPSDHEGFMLAEQATWRASLEAGRVVVAVTPEDEAIGFASLGYIDAEGHLQQVSVRRKWMKRGVGRALVEHAIAWGGGALWLTTYEDVAWNRPYYERFGFTCVNESDWRHEMRRVVDHERRALPAPEKRVVMVRRVSAENSSCGAP